MTDDPPFLSVGTEVSAKYKGAFCEAKIRKVVKSVKCKILFKQGLGMESVADDAVKGTIRVGAVVEARHPERKEYIEGTITKIQDCSQYTVVFDDGDITTLRRTALCLKSGRHFAESETLDQLPLTHPEHFSNPVIGGRRGRRRGAESSDEEEVSVRTKAPREEKEADIGRVVCVEGDKKKQRDNWFPGLVVAPTAQDTVKIHVREEYLVRSFKDGRYYTVPKKETTEFTREVGAKVDNHSVKTAVEKALLFLDKDELPPHWDRDSLFGLNEPSTYESDHDSDSDNPDDEPREEKDHFVAQLYKFMDDRGTPINQGPTICSRDVDLYRLFYVVHNLGGYNRVTNHNHWKTVSRKLGYGQSPNNLNLVKHVYKRFLHSFEEFYRKLGCTMVSHPRTYRNRGRAGRSLIRDKDRLSAKAESKERSDADESEEASVAGSLGTLQDVQDIKIEVEESLPEPTPPPKIKVEPKEEVSPKKVIEKAPIKIKEEKKEEEAKVKPEPVKEKSEDKTREKTRMRQKLKVNEVKKEEQPPPPPPTPVIKKEKEVKKEEEVKEEVKPVEKKKRLFTRRLIKEKLGAVKSGGGGAGLAATRQKRTIKDRVKEMVNKFKFRKDTKEVVKDTSSVTSDSSNDKVQNTVKEKVKVKEEPVAPLPVNKKKEETVVKEPINPPIEEKKKVGRKKKEKKEIDDTFDSLPTYKTVCVGDKLKVYYGPTNESKVTYEAKVLSVKTDGPEILYMVHYTGWNNRYDEYIKHSRIADNLSWVPGRASKKTNLSFLKPGRRKNSISKPETSSNKSENGNSKVDGKESASKSDSQMSNNGKSPIESTPPGKAAKPVGMTRSSLRSSKKEEIVSDNEAEEDAECSIPSLYMSNELLSEKTRSEKVKEILGINDESSLLNVTERRKMKRRNGAEDANKPEIRATDDASNMESSPPKIDRRKKRSQSESENNDIVEKKRQLTRRRRSSSTNDDKSDSNISVEPESPSSVEEKKRTRKRSLGLDSPDPPGIQKKRRFISEKKTDPKQTDAISQQNSGNDDESTKKSADTETEEASKGRDFDLIQIRSELKGLDKAVKSEGESFKTTASDTKTASEKKAETDKLAEDIYEFKEPEPFEFEVCKSSEDKGKSLQRRPLGRLFDDPKKHPAVLLPNMFYKGKKESKSEEIKKNFFDSVYSFEEESTDKISTSPSRPVDEPGCKPFQLFTDLPEGENEDESKEGPDNPLNVTYTVTKSDLLENNPGSKSEEEHFSLHSLSPKSNSPTEIELNDNSNMDSNEVESTSKSCFSRDDDEDELEDESINFAIQRAIIREISDDEDTETRPPVNLETESTLFSSSHNKIPDKPVIVESINVHESDDTESCAIMDSSDKMEFDEKCEDEERSTEGTATDEESDAGRISGEKEDDEEEIKEEIMEAENETVTDLASSPVIISTSVETGSIVITNEDLVSTGTIMTPIVVPADTKEDTIEFSATEGDGEEVARTFYTVPGSPSDIKSLGDPVMEPIDADVQVEADVSDRSDTEIDPSNLEVQEESIKMESDTEFTFKPITVPPPDESESTISIPYTENKSADELIINLEPLKPEKDIKNDSEENARTDLNLDSLLCEETIPGSPSSHTDLCDDNEQEKIETAMVETLEVKVESIEEVISQPIVEEVVRTEEPPQTVNRVTPRSSPSDSPVLETSSTSPPQTSSYRPTLEDRHFLEQKESDEESKADKTPTKQETGRKVGSVTKRHRPNKKRHVEIGKRRYNRSKHVGSDSDDTSENSLCTTYNRSSHSLSANSDNKDYGSGDSSRTCKYNFLVSFDSSMNQNTRINLIQSSIQQIRKVYADLKSELAVIDRRRKKLRKRERESLAAVRIH